MLRRPPRSTRTDTLFPYTTLFRSGGRDGGIRAFEQAPARLSPRAHARVCRRWSHARGCGGPAPGGQWPARSEEHTSELQSLMRISYAVFCLKKKKMILRTDTTRLT